MARAKKELTFVVADTFCMRNEKSDVQMAGRMNSRQRSHNFFKWFYDKKEVIKPKRELELVSFFAGDSDACLIEKIGGEEKAVVELHEVWRLLQAQPNGEAGKLPIKLPETFFYAYDANNVLRKVSIYLIPVQKSGIWTFGGWRVSAFELNSQESIAHATTLYPKRS